MFALGEHSKAGLSEPDFWFCQFGKTKIYIEEVICMLHGAKRSIPGFSEMSILRWHSVTAELKGR